MMIFFEKIKISTDIYLKIIFYMISENAWRVYYVTLL